MLFRSTPYFILIYLLIFFGYLNAQTPSYIHYDVSNGLPTNEIYSLKQDKKGFLWIGTDAGLVRYDGNSFFLFNNTNSRGASVSGLIEDQYGKMWFNNFSGQIFYAKGDSVYQFQPWEKYYKTQLTDFTIDNNNNIIIDNNENYIYRFKGQQSIAEKLVDNVNPKQAIAKMFDGTIVFTLLNRAQLFSLESDNSIKLLPIYELDGTMNSRSSLVNQFQFYNSFLNKQTLGLQRRNPNDKQPYLYYYKNGGIYVHPVSLILQQLKLYPLSAYDDDAGNLFIGTELGILWIKKNEKGYYVQKYFLKNESISGIIKTKEGSVWICTLKNGIYQIPDLNIWISGGFELGLKTEGVSNIKKGKNGTLYAASIAGEIFEYQKFTNTPVKKFKQLYERYIQAMEYDSTNDQLYLSKLLTDVLNLKTGKYEEHNFGSSSKDYFFRKDGVIFSSGNALVASVYNDTNYFKKIIKEEFNTEQDTILKVVKGNYKSAFLLKQRNKGIWYQEQEKILWVGLVDGLQFHENHTWKKFYDPDTNQPIIAFHFAELKDGTMCIATINQGLYLVKNKKVVQHLTQQKGLLSNRIKRIATDEEAIWMIMPGAVQGYNIRTNQFTKLVIANNAAKQELYDVVVLRDTVYVATSKGIQFFPETIDPINREAPNVFVNSFIVDGIKMNSSSEMQLPQSTNTISIALQGISIKSSGGFIFQYRLIGSDTNWVSASASQNIIRYASLPSGKYIFEARVLNEDGLTSKENAVVSFQIELQWWKRAWVIFFALLFLLLASYIFYSYRINTLKKKNLEEIEKVRVLDDIRNSQLSALKAQMNPHFIFNVLNSIQEIILLNDKKEANIYLGKFADLMRLILDQSNKVAISLDDEIRSLKLYLELEALRFEENFKYEIKVADMLYTYNIDIPAMLIQPYLENAIKHGLMHKHGEKSVALSFSLFNENTLLCVITDNGIGRKRSSELNRMREKKHTSFATGATQRRLELLNQGRTQTITVTFVDLMDEHRNVCGTKVLLYIPLVS
jgi:sensor histidine kinase YesM/ligand-binding sensor domain-containing protein